MKKFFICLLAGAACVFSQSSFAAVTAFAESVREMNAILDATADPEFSDLFAADDFIVDLERLTPKLDSLGNVKYLLSTCKISNKNTCKKVKNYAVKLLIEQNPGIGPNLITVVDIKKL